MEGASVAGRRIARPYRLLLVATVALLCFAAMRPQPAPADVMRKFQGRQVIWYDRPAAVRATGSRDRVVGRWRKLEARRGIRDRNGECLARPPAFSGNSEIVLYVAEEVAYDPAKCRSLYRITRRSPAKLNRAAVRAAVARQGMSQRQLAQSPDPNDPNVQVENAGAQYGPQPTDDVGAIAASVKRKVVTGYSAWEDPVQLDVNKVSNSVNFRASRKCAAASQGSLWDQARYRWGTGWSKIHHDLQTYWGCSHATSKTYARFRNMLFCDPTSETRTRMWPNRVAGYPGGSWVHEPLGMSKTGDCAGLLHTETKAKVQETSDPAFKGL